MDKVELKKKAYEHRLRVLEMVTNANSGHPGGALGMADVMTALHYEFLKDDPDNPDWEDRDRFILSNGHTCPLLYSILADKGYFPEGELWNLRRLGALLQGHPSTAWDIPGVEFSSGSLGHGLSFGCGVALSGRLDDKDFATYVSISDAECQEGQTWEAATMASHYDIGNICAIIDYNDSQIDGNVSDILDVSPLADKWEAFNWRVIEIDGHDYDEIFDALKTFEDQKDLRGRPTVIISKNTIGKGVSFMEGDHTWHHGVLTDEQLEQAREELGSVIEK